MNWPYRNGFPPPQPGFFFAPSPGHTNTQPPRSWFVSWLAVGKGCERKGYSTYLLEKVKDLAIGFGVHHIYLEVGIPSKIADDDDWEGVIAFYKKLGLVEVERGDVLVSDEIKGCCKEYGNGKGTHQLLKWDLLG
mmetsp:Transcript_15992/g.45899  ORF Transcript_15992/g.45899 Transcript_15992/m.45899 type:complete len:135 (-) Transcript_15992:105-509(-)